LSFTDTNAPGSGCVFYRVGDTAEGAAARTEFAAETPRRGEGKLNRRWTLMNADTRSALNSNILSWFPSFLTSLEILLSF
jgi:hypothetical protein